MIDKQFDNILKRKLNNMTETSSSDWSVFEHILDDANLSGNAVEGDFDSAIKQKLAGITAASLSSDWSTFEHILDEDQLTDDMLDDKVSQEMNRMRVPYRQDHWELLHSTLEYQKQRNSSVIGYKIIELSLLLILLLSANNLYKYLPSTFELEKPMIYASLEDNQKKDRKESITEQSVAKADIHKNSVVAVRAPLKTIINTLETPLNIVQTSNDVDLASVSENFNELANTHNSKQTLVSQVVQSSNVQILGLKADQSVSTLNLDKAPVVSLLQMDNISSLQQGILASQTVSGYTPHHFNPKSKIEKSIFVFAGLDNNLVNSPFDDVYDTEGFRTYGIGYSAGVEYGIKKDKKAIAVGIGYSNRAYEPRIIEELTGNPALTLYETSLDHIEFNIMSLSAGLKYMLVETDKWALDLGIGASANVVVSSDYSIETRTIRDGKHISSRDGRLPFSNLDDKPLHDGIFENGSLKENIYFTTDLSIGLHRQLSKNAKFTLRPKYSAHSFSNGIGPNNDLINNLSLNLGVTYTL